MEIGLAGFKRRLKNINVVSFDIFDTLLGRRCPDPNDVFRIMEVALVSGSGGSYRGFSTKRREADSPARRLAWETTGSEEVSLEMIFELIKAQNPTWDKSVGEFVELELKVERTLLYPLKSGIELIEIARDIGKKVVLTSDMYLPEAFCRECLAEHGVVGYDAFFLSSSIGKLKYTGNLFTHLIESLGEKPENILHIGDNLKSDVEQARKCGLRTMQTPKPVDVYLSRQTHPFHRIIHSEEREPDQSLIIGASIQAISREKASGDPFWYQIGSQFAAPLIYGFVGFIIQNVKGRGLSTIYFLSRDGYILKAAYEKLTSGRSDCPQAKYLYASRRALNFAAIECVDEPAVNWLSEGINLTVGDFFNRIHLNPEEHLETLQKYGFEGVDSPVKKGTDYERLRDLIRELSEPILKAVQEERSNYMDYLQSAGVFSDTRFVFVDVGWKTSLQHSLDRLIRRISPDMKIEGLYLGTYPEAQSRRHPRSTHQSYLLQYGMPTGAMRTIRLGVGLVEFFFAAPENTFLYMYRDANDVIKPVFSKDHDNTPDLFKLSAIHLSVLDFCEDIKKIEKIVSLPKLSPDEVLSILERLLGNPTPSELKELSKIKYPDGYGHIFNHCVMAQPSGLLKLGFSKSKWKQEFKHSHWPVGYYRLLNPLEKLVFKFLHPAAKFSKPHN